MNILYIGDIMGAVGVEVVEQLLPNLRETEALDLVIAQAENVTGGRGLTPKDYNRLRSAGVDFCTGGNWSLYHHSIIPLMNDQVEPVIRPANYPSGTPGLGYKYIDTQTGRVLVVSLLGQIVGKDSDKKLVNPLQCIDNILEKEKQTERVGTIVNFHGDFSSEKVIIGHYLDGRVTAVIGDHWHVQTADERILPSGTAHITDVGMCGVLNSSLGISFDSVIPRWREGQKTKNLLETNKPWQFNAVKITTDRDGSAIGIKRIHITIPT
jgi:metallophosphoesterase (TIGR00282 family)